MTRNRLHPAIERVLEVNPFAPAFVWTAIERYAEVVLAVPPDVTPVGDGQPNAIGAEVPDWREVAQLFAEGLSNTED